MFKIFILKTGKLQTWDSPLKYFEYKFFYIQIKLMASKATTNDEEDYI